MLRKSAIPLIFSLIVFLLSCKKEQDTTFEYEIQGVENLIAKVGETKVLDIKISKVHGVEEKVTLALKNVPVGVSYAFESNGSTPDYVTTLSINIGNIVRMGNHVITLEASSENLKKTMDFNLTIDDNVTMTMKVFDATMWSPDSPAGKLAIGATVSLYKDSLSFANKTPFYSTVTDSSGMAYFYHLDPSPYLFIVEKGELSNIVLKQVVNGKLQGYATSNVDKFGKLECRDQNGDGKITEVDRIPYDRLVIYEDIFSERIIWIGN